MSIASEIARISKNVEDSLDAVALKGVTVPTGSNSDDLPDLIAQISGGGSGGVVITDTTDSAGGTVRTITAVEISGTKQITSNGTGIDVTTYEKVDVAVPSSSPTLQTITKSYTPTESQQTETITAGTGYDGIEEVDVTVGAISSSYVGSGITRRDSTALSASGDTVTVPAGYYASQATKAVSAGSAGTPTATKGTVSNHSVSVTPSVTNQTGYITGSTKTGTAVTVNVTELESGNKEITANGTNISVSGYSTVSVAVPSSGSKNVQTVQSTSRRNNTALGSITSLTCSTAGTYDVYWTCARSNTSQTWGSQLYIGGSAYDSENTTWSNNVQNNHLENVSISANQTVAVYGRSRSGYYIYAPQLTIVQK